jgi:hypothetical protein
MRAEFKRQALVATHPVLPDPHRSVMPAPGLQNMPVESRSGELSAPAESAVWQGSKGMADPQPEGDGSPVAPVGRRAAPRLRISLPGQLIAVDKVHSCVLMNLSRSGAQVAILDSLRKGEGAILRCGAIDHFALVTRSEFGLNALTFDEPLSDALVIEIRRYNENFEERERRALIETARKWVTGDTGDDRAI